MRLASSATIVAFGTLATAVATLALCTSGAAQQECRDPGATVVQVPFLPPQAANLVFLHYWKKACAHAESRSRDSLITSSSRGMPACDRILFINYLERE